MQAESVSSEHRSGAEPREPVPAREVPLPVLGAVPRAARPLLAPLLFVLSVAAMAWLRLWYYPDRLAPIGYGVPLAGFLLLRNRRWMWASAAAFAVLSFVEVFVALPRAGSASPW